eukprot:8885213-Pyramimonas_sp.AAC.1
MTLPDRRTQPLRAKLGTRRHMRGPATAVPTRSLCMRMHARSDDLRSSLLPCAGVWYLLVSGRVRWRLQ